MLHLQNYSRDLFLFLYFLLIIVAAMTSLTGNVPVGRLVVKSSLSLLIAFTLFARTSSRGMSSSLAAARR
uniref:Uncharacterized protein n=1 Tax=Zea mays TaxID=4577 RepID=C4J6H3_MAIZE|nr:unknown [Zea mays]